MHFGLVTDEYCAPFPTSRGTAINMWSIMESLLKADHKVTVFLISNEGSHRVEELVETGVTVRTLPYGNLRSSWPYDVAGKPREIFCPELETFYPWVTLAPKMKRMLEEVNPDALLAYTLYNLSVTHGIDRWPRMAVLVDLEHVLAHHRWLAISRRPVRRFLRASLRRLAYTKQPKYMIQLLADCQSIVDFAAHHAAWLRENGLPNCIYIPPPTRDPVGSQWREHRDSYSARNTARILLIGHLAGIASISGITFFVKKVLPILERKLESEKVEIHVVGDYSKNPGFAAQLRHPMVRLRGYVEDVNREFLSSDVLLVPTPINLGTRTRIIEGFSYGCCVVAHEANALGIPQMVHGKNALLAGNGEELADAVICALTDHDLRGRLQSNARRTYEESFSIESAGARLTAEMERIALNGAAGRLAGATATAFEMHVHG